MLPLKNNSSLYISTADPGAASTDAVVRPQPGSPPLQWYRDTKPRFYSPYLIRVLSIDDTWMKFVFLDSQTGADLPPPPAADHYEIKYHDGRYAYSALPSTAQNAKPGDEQSQSCGLLFISDLYMQNNVPESVRTTLATTPATTLATARTGDSKWPYSAGTSSELSTRRHAELSGRLSPQEEADLAQMVEPPKLVT